MGDPQHAYPVIHITGTNGKGSTAADRHPAADGPGPARSAPTPARTSSGSTSASPSNGEPIDDDDFAEQIAAVADLEVARRRAAVATSRSLTAAAFRWFADVAVDVAVRRGRAARPVGRHQRRRRQVAVVTNVGLDHTEFAGPTAGRHRPREGRHRQARLARSCSARPTRSCAAIFLAEEPGRRRGSATSTSAPSRTSSPSAAGCSTLRTPLDAYPEVFLPLHGRHQGDNAAVALAAVESFFAAPLDLERGAGGLRRGAGARAVRGARPPAARHRRRRPQPRRRRRVRHGVRATTSTRPGGGSSSSACCGAASRTRCSRRSGSTTATSWSAAPRRSPGPCRPRTWPRAARDLGIERGARRARRGAGVRRRPPAGDGRRRRARDRLALRRRRGPPPPPPSPAWLARTPVGGRLRGEQAVAGGEGRRLGPVRGARLLEDGPDVVGGGVRADVQLGADLPVGSTGGDEQQHLHLPARQPGRPGRRRRTGRARHDCGRRPGASAGPAPPCRGPSPCDGPGRPAARRGRASPRPASSSAQSCWTWATHTGDRLRSARASAVLEVLLGVVARRRARRARRGGGPPARSRSSCRP